MGSAGLTRRQLLRGAAVTAATVAVAPAGATRAGGARDALTRGTWLAGDTHVHTDHSSDGSFLRQGLDQRGPGNMSVADQIGQGERIGLDWMPLTDHRTYDQHWDPQWRSSSLLLVPGEEANGAPHAICLGAVDVVVDGGNPPGSPVHRHVQQSIWEAHAQDAVWSLAHPDTVRAENLSTVGSDLIEVWNRASIPDRQVDFAEARWNAGFRTGVAGACDCHFKEIWAIAGPGMPTTWVHAQERSERAILDGLRAGRTSLSYTPLGAFVTLEADADRDGVFEVVGGDEVRVAPGARVTLRVRVRNGLGSTVLVYAAPGRAAGPVVSQRVTSPDLTFTTTVTAPARPGWWRVELRGIGQPAGVSTEPADNVPTGLDALQALAAPVFSRPTAAPVVPAPAVPLPAASGRDAGRVVLGTPGTFTGFADVTHGTGGAHVVAELHTSSGTSVVHLSPSGRRTVLARRSARMPRVVARNRDVWVAWQDERGGQRPRNPQVYLRHSRDGGRTWDREVRVSDGRGRQERVALALGPSGPVLAWQAATGGAVDVLVKAIGVDRSPVNVSAAGKQTDPGTPLDTRSARWPASLFPDLTVLPNGTVLVTWQDDRHDPDPLWTGHMPPLGQPESGGTDPDAWEPMLAVRRRGGAWSAPRRLAPRADRAQCHPTIAVGRNGSVVCAWDSRPLASSGVNPRIVAVTSSNGGATWSAPVEVDVSPSYFAQRPRASADRDGTMRLVWYDSRSADWRWQVRTATLRAGRWVAGGAVLTNGNCTWPALDQGVVVATSDRGAHSQRDRTQRIVRLALAR